MQRRCFVCHYYKQCQWWNYATMASIECHYSPSHFKYNTKPYQWFFSIPHSEEDVDNKIFAQEIMTILNDKEKQIIILYYEGLNLSQIGKLLKLTRERIRMIKEISLKKLRRHISDLNKKNNCPSYSPSNKAIKIK